MTPKNIILNLEALEKDFREARRAIYDTTNNRLLIVQHGRKPEPCDIQPLAGSKLITYDPANQEKDCADPELALFYISKWEDHKNYQEKAQAADLNNRACAELWKKEPDWKKAKQILADAHEKEPENATVEHNLHTVEDFLNWILPKPTSMVALYLVAYERAVELGKKYNKAVDVMGMKEIREHLGLDV